MSESDSKSLIGSQLGSPRSIASGGLNSPSFKKDPPKEEKKIEDDDEEEAESEHSEEVDLDEL